MFLGIFSKSSYIFLQIEHKKFHLCATKIKEVLNFKVRYFLLSIFSFCVRSIKKKHLGMSKICEKFPSFIIKYLGKLSSNRNGISCFVV